MKTCFVLLILCCLMLPNWMSFLTSIFIQRGNWHLSLLQWCSPISFLFFSYLDLWLLVGRKEKIGSLGWTYTHCLLCLERVTNQNLLYSTWNSAHCYVAAWMRGGFGEPWIRVYVWLNPFAIHPKLSQHCSSAISQYKIRV